MINDKYLGPFSFSVLAMCNERVTDETGESCTSKDVIISDAYEMG